MDPRERDLEELAHALREKLIERRRAAAAAGQGTGGDIAAAVEEIVGSEAALLAARDREALAARILRDTAGLGPLQELLDDRRVEEVMVNGPGCVYVEPGGTHPGHRGSLPRRGGATQHD
jgi:Flp pilus assembly CpaF family ATPase